MQQADPVFVAQRLDHAFVNRRDGPQVRFQILVDHRTHHVALAPFVDAGEHIAQNAFHRGARHVPGEHRLAAGRHRPNTAQPNIAIEKVRVGARDRRRRHHEKVDVFSFFQQRPALVDAKALLLVRHDEAELFKIDFFLKQRVGADHDSNFPFLQAGQHVPLFLGGQRGDQQAGRQAERF